MTSKLLSISTRFSYTSEQISWLEWFVATEGFRLKLLLELSENTWSAA